MSVADVQNAVTLVEVKQAVDAAAGRVPGSLLLKNAKLLNVLTLEVQETHVLVAGRLIAGVGEVYAAAEAEVVVDLAGQYLAPGLIDGHVHLESSLVSPGAYAEGVVPRGVTGVVCDPHEIANVAGVAGIHWLIEQSEGLPFDVWVTVPSCVPATSLETSGATLGLSEIYELLTHPRVVGVAEIMSFTAVIAGDEENLSKVLLAEQFGKSPEGHAPGVTGCNLQAYLASGIASDHEATTLAEGLEKLRAGMFLMIREGSVTRNLEALMPLVDAPYADRIGFVTDDRLPDDVLAEGGVDCLVRAAIKAGVAPVLALRCASWNTARHFRLRRQGAVAPGYLADIAVISNLQTFEVASVYKAGVRVAEGGKMLHAVKPRQVNSQAVTGTVKLPELTAASFKLADPGTTEVRVIRPIPYQVLTEEVVMKPSRRDGELVADANKDLAKLICVHRHGKNANVAAALVTGFGLRAGALASTVGHDHHNLLAVGMNDRDLLVAAERLEHLGGGFVAVRDAQVLAELALPLAGLITDEPLETVREALEQLERAATSLGVNLPRPFMTLSFLGLAVIPELRLTDMGLVDVLKSSIVPVGVG